MIEPIRASELPHPSLANRSGRPISASASIGRLIEELGCLVPKRDPIIVGAYIALQMPINVIDLIFDIAACMGSNYYAG